MRVEFLNLNGDPKCDPEIKLLPLSQDEHRKPPSYCLPWVEAARYSIQLKSNEEYVIRKGEDFIDAWALRDGKKFQPTELWLDVPREMSFVPKNSTEAMEKKVQLTQSPSFSSPWQRSHHHSVTLKLGIYWWTPPGWGLFFTSAIHRNEGFRVVEGFVRTDQWHRDIPIVIQPLVKEVRIPKYAAVATALLLPAEDLELSALENDLEKIGEVVKQVSQKRLNAHIYKKMVLPKKK